MRVLTLLLILTISAVMVEARHRKRIRRAHYRKPVPVVVIKDYGTGRFNLEKRLPEISTFLSAQKLTAHVGQSHVHNVLGWAHLNALDVSVRPSSVKGKKLILFLKLNMIPFISISGAKKGVSTGPHIHVGFPSPHTDLSYPVGKVDGKFNDIHCPFYKGYGGLICF